MKMLGKAFLAAALSGAVLVGAAGSVASANIDAASAVKERQDHMKRFGKNMKAIIGFVKKDEGSAQDVADRAAEIAKWAKDIPTWFPEGTSLEEVSKPETGAKPDIWKDWDKFEAAAANLSEKAAKLAEVAGSGADKGAIAAQLGDMGKNGCGGCHKPFREKLD
ncbi:c-type cytochrome [Aestuariispira ectoiniformans]|uniref:c-type cytochrome n=1 Tax=Aestuariispira ectoiniformans TaxID=2775080 RepID=UPI00223AC6CB|nr:cytochrome c [Aestuariispira ectoiniformans]